MRVGILGGTFDPIHIGHLVAAEAVRYSLELDQVIFIPAGRSPLKPAPAAPASQRLAMVELAIRSNPYFRVSTLELERPGPSYTVDTLRQLRADLGPAVELYFIAGQDAVADLARWHQPRELLSLCRLVAVTRPSYTSFDPRRLEAAIPGVSESLVLVEMPLIGVSASDLRRRVREGRPIKYLVPEAVEEYIYRHGLYKPRPGGGA